MAVKPFGVEAGLEIIESDGSGSTQHLRGTVDPTAGAGVPAPVSSLFARDVAGTDSELYQKFGPADTDWRKMAAGTAAGIIGDAEDADYTDGLFTDFAPTTPTGTAVDRFNEILKALAPPPAPNFSQISSTTTGVAGRLSFGASNPIAGYANVDGTGGSTLDINGLFDVAGTRRGLFSGNTNLTGVLNDDVAAHAYSYPANAFGNANDGELRLELNGVVVQVTDLAVLGSGTDVNLNGSGFTLSAATPVQFEDGTPLDQFQYRTGSYVVAAADQRDGYNYIRVSHFYSGTDHWSGYFEWVNDPEPTALSATGQVLDSLVMTGSRFLSGVEYNTGGTALYDVILQNVHRNVYSSASTAVSFSVVNGSATAQALGTILSEAEDEQFIDKSISVVGTGRLLDAPLTVGVNCDHPLKAALANAAQLTIPGLLTDNVTTANTGILENFCLEDYRLQDVAGATNNYAAQADIALGTWDPGIELNVAAAGYDTGLLVYAGAVRYPTQGLAAGDFRNTADGNLSGPENGPAGNPNYSAITGNRTFYRRFQNTSGLTKANFKILFTGTGDFTDLVAGPNGQALTVEMKFPDGSITTGTGWMDAYADFATATWTDGAGCRNAGTGVGRAMGTDWGITIGTKAIAANESVVIRITASDAWTGSITSIQLTWL